MKKFYSFVLFVAFLCYSQDSLKPTTFRGVPFNANVNELKKEIPDCNCIEVEGSKVSCKSVFKIGMVEIKNSFLFINDTLKSILGNFNPDHFNFLKDIFIKKYGNFNDADTEIVQTHMGGSFQNEEYFWKFDNLIISIEKYRKRIDEGAFFIVPGSISQMEKDQEREKEKAAKDF